MAGKPYIENEGMILIMDGGMSLNTEVGQSTSATDSEAVDLPEHPLVLMH